MKPPIPKKQPYSITSNDKTRVDNYYWLRDDERKNIEVISYLDNENLYTDHCLDKLTTLKSTLYNEITSYIKQDHSTIPVYYKGYNYYTVFNEGNEYPNYVRKPEFGNEEQILLNLLELKGDSKYFTIGHYEISPNDELIAWTEDNIGRRQYSLKIKNLKTNELLEDTLTNIDASIVWISNSDFIYITEDPVTLLSNKVFKHTLGTKQEDDILIYHETDESFYVYPGLSKDEKYVIITIESKLSMEYRVCKFGDTTCDFKVLIPRQKDHLYFINHLNDSWIIRTNKDAKNFKIVKMKDETLEWETIVDHDENILIDNFDIFNDFIAIEERSNGLANVRISDYCGNSYLITADEPTYTLNLECNYRNTTTVLRYGYTSLTTPKTIYELDIVTKQKTFIGEQTKLLNYNKENYTSEYIWATAIDGTKIPISLIYRKGTLIDGTAPLLQEGYGSYGSVSNSEFYLPILPLLDRGFVYAIAHIRGGQEMGFHWYEQGKLFNKKNTFTDFINCTDHLVNNGYVDSKKVFALGGSAGGLLMGAVANMAPEKYCGMIVRVPFVDVVTTMLDDTIPLTTIEYDEWGNPNLPDYYEYMLSYSPYDNIKSQNYPAMFVTTGLWDSQVQYYEPAKWVAKLREYKTDNNEILFRINMKAGHSGTSGRYEKYHEISEYFSFILDLSGYNLT